MTTANANEIATQRGFASPSLALAFWSATSFGSST